MVARLVSWSPTLKLWLFWRAWLFLHIQKSQTKSGFSGCFSIGKGGWQVPSRGPPVRHFLQMSTKPVTTTATTATRAGCVRHGLGPKTQHTSAEHRGLTADKISVIKQLAYKNKAFISFFKENVRYPVWTCRDPISLNLGTRFSLILGTRC